MKNYREILERFAEIKEIELEKINGTWRFVYRRENGFTMYHKIYLWLYRDIVQTYENNGEYGLENVDLPVWCCGV